MIKKIIIVFVSLTAVFSLGMAVRSIFFGETPIVFVHPEELPLSSPGGILDSPEKVRAHFLSQKMVHQEIISRQGRWWTEVKVFPDKKDEWVIILGNGNGRCESSYQCFMRMKKDKAITLAFKCNDGWTCE